MKLKKFLSVLLAGITAITATFSVIPVSAEAVSKEQVYTGANYYVQDIPVIQPVEAGHEEGLVEDVWIYNDDGVGTRWDIIYANLSVDDTITVKVTQTGKEYTMNVLPSLYMDLDDTHKMYPAYPEDGCTKSGKTISELIEHYTEMCKLYPNNYGGDKMTCSLEDVEWFYTCDDHSDFKNKTFEKFTWEITISSSSASTTKPEAVKPILTAASSSWIKLGWSDNGADSYNIYRSTSRNGTYKKIASTKTNAYTNKNLTLGKTYYYKVTAVADGVESDFSKIVSAKPEIIAPTSVKAVPASTTSIKLTWDKVGADSYNIYRATSKSGTYKKIASTTKNTYTNKSLTKGKTYYYKVTAVIDGEESEFSKIVSSKPTAPIPSAVKASSKASGEATVTWKKSTGAKGYEIYMATSKSGTYKRVDRVGSKVLTFTEDELTEGKTYYFKVRSYTIKNGKRIYSPFSSVVKIKV